MKKILRAVAYTIAGAVAFVAGAWLWNNVLSDKVSKLKDRLVKKFKKRGA